MRKLAYIVLTAIIVCCGIFTTVILSSRGSDSNFFNVHVREKLVAYPVLRTLFDLHYDGDARQDYLGNKFPIITIEIDSFTDRVPSEQVLQRFADRIGTLLHKSITLTVSSTNIPYREQVSITDINELVAHEQTANSSPGTAPLYILFASRSSDTPTEIGTTYHENAIVIFSDALRDFSAEYPNTLDAYTYSTLLHEFGHQLGLPHNEEPGCLMNEHAESAHIPKNNVKDTVQDFCQYELEEIRSSILNR